MGTVHDPHQRERLDAVLADLGDGSQDQGDPRVPVPAPDVRDAELCQRHGVDRRQAPCLQLRLLELLDEVGPAGVTRARPPPRAPPSPPRGCRQDLRPRTIAACSATSLMPADRRRHLERRQTDLVAHGAVGQHARRTSRRGRRRRCSSSAPRWSPRDSASHPAQSATRPSERTWSGGNPSSQRCSVGDLAQDRRREQLAVEHGRRERPVTGRQRLADRCVALAVLVVPFRRSSPQPRLGAGVDTAELREEQLGEQVVQPEGVTIVERQHEEVARGGERVEHLGAVVALHHPVAQRRRQAVQDRRLEQERPPVGGQAVQHLLVQVLRHPLVRREHPTQHEGWVGVLGEREHAQVQPRRPPVGATDQLLHDVARQLVELAGDLERLGGRVGEIGLVELDETSGQAPARQTERRQRPPGQGEGRALGDQVDQVVHRRHRVAVVDEMDVVEHQQERGLGGLEGSGECRQHLVGDPRITTLEQVLGARHVQPARSRAPVTT